MHKSIQYISSYCERDITANNRNFEFEKKCKEGIYKDLESISQQGK